MTTVNEIICQVVAVNPGIATEVLEIETYARVRALRKHRGPYDGPRLTDPLYYAGGGYFWQRLDRMCKSGRLVKLIVAGRAHYYLAAQRPTPPGGGAFDLTDRTVRMVAADAAEEAGRVDIARDLRLASRVVG